MEISRRTDKLEKGVQETTNYAESKVKSAKTTLTKPWNSCVEYDDQEEKKITREKANFFVASRWSFQPWVRLPSPINRCPSPQLPAVLKSPKLDEVTD
jgi:hypothetical protein